MVRIGDPRDFSFRSRSRVDFGFRRRPKSHDFGYPQVTARLLILVDEFDERLHFLFEGNHEMTDHVFGDADRAIEVGFQSGVLDVALSVQHRPNEFAVEVVAC